MDQFNGKDEMMLWKKHVKKLEDAYTSLVAR
jgi:hypothetical protein